MSRKSSLEKLAFILQIKLFGKSNMIKHSEGISISLQNLYYYIICGVLLGNNILSKFLYLVRKSLVSTNPTFYKFSTDSSTVVIKFVVKCLAENYERVEGPLEKKSPKFRDC